MAEIDITKSLSGSLSETYFKEKCDQEGLAYISLEQIHENKIKDNVLKFKKGFNRMLIHLPEEIVKEVEDISKPSNASILNPSYVYDFLLCKVGQTSKDSDIIKKKKIKDFLWAEVKTGYSQLSKRQIRTLSKIKIPLYRFRIPNSLVGAEEVEIFFDIVDEKFLLDHGLDSTVAKNNMLRKSLKENKTSFKKVTPEKFSEVKKGLKKLFNVTEFQSKDPSVVESFEIVSLGAKFPVSYYKTGTLLMQGDKSLDDFKRALDFIKYSLKNDP